MGQRPFKIYIRDESNTTVGFCPVGYYTLIIISIIIDLKKHSVLPSLSVELLRRLAEDATVLCKCQC